MSNHWPTPIERLGRVVKHLKRALEEADELKMRAQEIGHFTLHQEAAWCWFHISELITHAEAVVQGHIDENS